MARGGSSVLLMGFNPTTGKFQPILVNDLTGALEVDAIVTTSLGDIVNLPDNVYRHYDEDPPAASPVSKTVQADLIAASGAVSVVLRTLQIEVRDANVGVAIGDEVGSVKFKTPTQGAFGDAVPLFNQQALSLGDFQATEIEVTLLNAVANTRVMVFAVGRKVS